MAEVSKEQALEAYDMLRMYCTVSNCENCIFVCSDESSCIFECPSPPFNWDTLEID